MHFTNFLKTVAFTLAFAASTAFAHGDEHTTKQAYDQTGMVGKVVVK